MKNDNVNETIIALLYRRCEQDKRNLDDLMPGLYFPLPPDEQDKQADVEIFRDRALKNLI